MTRSEPALRRSTSLLPPNDVRDVALVFIIAVLVFLASLTALGALAADHTARDWKQQLASSATAVIRPGVNDTPNSAAARAAEVLAGIPGVEEARAMDRQATDALLVPWLGKDAITEDLPTPRLVALELDSERPPTSSELQAALKAARIDGTIDDHGYWMKDLQRGANLARLSLAAVVLLITLAAAAVVAFATQAGMAAHHEVVEVLHLAGAKPSSIAWLFIQRFASLAAMAGLLGGSAAAILAAIARLAIGRIGSSPQPMLAWRDLILVLLAPALAAGVAALAARFAALRMVGQMI